MSVQERPSLKVVDEDMNFGKFPGLEDANDDKRKDDRDYRDVEVCELLAVAVTPRVEM